MNKAQQTVVIKFGGNALNEQTGAAFCQVLAKLPAMGFSPIVVHGGGPQIDALLQQLNITSRFVDGLRYTDAATLQAAEMVLSGQVNKMLVQFLADQNIPAVGISGKDGQTLIAEKMHKTDDGKPIDLGFVGRVVTVTPSLLHVLIDNGFVPVIAPLAYGKDKQTYNVNADYAAAAIAKAISAKHFIVMTNIDGLLDKQKNIIHYANSQKIQQLIADGVIQGGMIPKTLSAIDTLSNVGEVNIIDGRQADNLTAILSGKTIGTTIVAE